MNPPSATQKKVSRACNTCRLKRKKCDGLDPCLFCTETKVECSYSREPRRRGPPSGYLRYTETRVTLLETLLGLCISQAPDKALPALTLECVQALRAESTSCTQDVWDNYKSIWTATDAARILDDLTNNFAPFPQRNEQDTFAKPLLPPAMNVNANTNTSAKANGAPATGPSPSVLNSSPSPSSSMPKEWNSAASPSVSFNIPASPSYSLSRESFERTQTPVPRQPEPRSFLIPRGEDLGFGFPSNSHASTSTGVFQSLPPPSPNYFYENSIRGADADVEMAGGDANGGGEYTGSYWRAADLDATSPSQRLDMLPTVESELPPPHVLSGLLDVYYQHVHPGYPLLPPRRTLEPAISGPNVSEFTSCLVLSLCSYSGRLSPSQDAAVDLSMFGGHPGKIAADLWYEQARTALGSIIRKETRIETIQALLLLALRDHGRGNDHQAWILVGVAVRMAQVLDLHVSPPPKARQSPDDIQLRQNLWGVCLILDLLLSLQLGKPPAVSDSLRSPPTLPSDQGQSLFTHTYTLCHIVSRINLHLYFGYTPSSQISTVLSTLKQELDVWQQTLPMQFRISLGHQPEQKVLEVNMFYHVAVILLYRPFYKEKSTVGTFLDAASTFNMLLEKYRNAHAAPSLGVCSPSMIYLIFTAAIAHLSGFKYKQNMDNGPSPTMALQTQLHLLNCLEALKVIGGTWELARRCWRTLDRLMELEGLKPAVSVQRKRERDSGDDAGPPPRSAAMFAPMEPDTGTVFPLDMHLSPLLLPADYFDPGVFGTGGQWVPDLGGGWDGEWDEKMWGKLGLGLDGQTS